MDVFVRNGQRNIFPMRTQGSKQFQLISGNVNEDNEQETIEKRTRRGNLSSDIHDGAEQVAERPTIVAEVICSNDGRLGVRSQSWRGGISYPAEDDVPRGNVVFATSIDIVSLRSLQDES